MEKGMEPINVAIVVLTLLITLAVLLAFFPNIMSGLWGGSNATLEASCNAIQQLCAKPDECTKEEIVSQYNEIKATQPEGSTKNIIGTCNLTITRLYKGEYIDKPKVDGDYVKDENFGNEDQIMKFCAEKCAREGT